EAVVAALYLDGGLEAARRFVDKGFGADVAGIQDLDRRDHKSALQELLQGRGEPLPEYVVAAEEGPGHRRRFRIRCLLQGRVVSEGEGFSKKEAELEAARAALETLQAR